MRDNRVKYINGEGGGGQVKGADEKMVGGAGRGVELER
jgi:hypothetical protein